MKKIFIIACSFCLIFSAAAASHAARLVWDAPPPCGDPDTCPVEGYVVYYGDVEADETFNMRVTTGTEQQLAPLRLQIGTTYRFAVSAYNAAGESDPSVPVTYTVPAYEPGDDSLPPEELVIQLPGRVSSIRFVFEEQAPAGQ